MNYKLKEGISWEGVKKDLDYAHSDTEYVGKFDDYFEEKKDITINVNLINRKSYIDMMNLVKSMLIDYRIGIDIRREYCDIFSEIKI